METDQGLQNAKRSEVPGFFPLNGTAFYQIR